MEHCQVPLLQLKRVIQSVARGGIFRCISMAVKLESRKVEISKYLGDIHFYRETIEFALQLIQPHSCSENPLTKLVDQLDNETKELSPNDLPNYKSKSIILQFPNWGNLLELLITCQCASQEFGQAEAVIIAAKRHIESPLTTNAVARAVYELGHTFVA